MRRILLLLSALMAATLVGCGGGGGGGAPSAFEGAFFGAFFDGDDTLNVIDLSISRSGSLSGVARTTSDDGQSLSESQISGRVASNGGVSISVRHPNGETQRMSGQAAMDPSGRWFRLTVVPDPNDPNVVIVVDMRRRTDQNVAGPLSGTGHWGSGEHLQCRSLSGISQGALSTEWSVFQYRETYTMLLGMIDPVLGRGQLVGWSTDGRVFRGSYHLGASQMEFSFEMQFGSPKQSMAAEMYLTP
ncbi:MAG: hypothetical protein WHU10_00830 [Fimbriimonadales bacterium]